MKYGKLVSVKQFIEQGEFQEHMGCYEHISGENIFPTLNLDEFSRRCLEILDDVFFPVRIIKCDGKVKLVKTSRENLNSNLMLIQHMKLRTTHLDGHKRRFADSCLFLNHFFEFLHQSIFGQRDAI